MKTILEINSNKEVIEGEIIKDNGCKKEISISPKEFLSLVKNSLKKEFEYVDTGIILHGKEGVVSKKINTSNNENWICILIDKHIGPFIYHKHEYDTTFPRTLFFLKVNEKDKTLKSMHLACIKDEKITENTQLYRWPYTNVGGTSPCLGGSRKLMKSIDNVDKLFKTAYAFMYSPSNDHNAYHTNNKNLSIIKILEEKPNIDDILLPLNKIFKNFWKELS